MSLAWLPVLWILSADLCHSQIASDWPAGTANISYSPEYNLLTSCEHQCFDAFVPGFETFSDTRTNCIDLTGSLTRLDFCIRKPTDPACEINDLSVASDNVKSAQTVLEDYCLDLAHRVATLSASSSFAIPSTPPTLPYPAATTASLSSLISTTVSATTTTGFLTATLDNSSTATQTQSSTGVATDSPTDLGASGLQPSASTLASASSSKGLSQKEQIGIGVGVGVGVPLIIALLAALFFTSRRRQNKASDRANPYGPVYASDKVATEDGNDHPGPQESHPMNSSATPFLPVPLPGNLPHHDEHDHEQDHDFEPRHGSMVDPQQSHPTPFGNEPRVQPQPPAPLTLPTTQSQIRTSTPTLAQQARESYRTQTPINDGPPSPISPVSPVSEMGSRPASLHSQHRSHDL